MTYLLINLVLGLAWMFLNGDPTLETFLFGLGLGFFALLPYRRMKESEGYAFRVVYVARFLVLFLLALVRSTLDVAWEIVTREHHMTPGVVEIDVEGMTPMAVFILANVISLTPGTMTIGVSRRKQKLYVHAMYASDPAEVVRDIERSLKLPLLRVLPLTDDVDLTIKGTEAR